MAKRGYAVVPSNEIRFVQGEVNRIAGEIQAIRVKRGLTQEQLAEKLDVSLGTITTIEQGIRMPSLPMLIRLSKALRFKLVLDAD